MYRLSMPRKTLETAVTDFAHSIGLLVRRWRAAAASQELSWTQVAVMKRLSREGPATTADLARAEVMKPQSMGTIIAALEEMGMVERKPHPTDGRQVNIELTAKGAAVRKSAERCKADVAGAGHRPTRRTGTGNAVCCRGDHQALGGKMTGTERDERSPAGGLSFMPIWKRNLAVCWFGIFVASVGMSQIAPVLPLYIQAPWSSGRGPHCAILRNCLWYYLHNLGDFLTDLGSCRRQISDENRMLLRASLGMAVVVSSMGFAQNVYILIGLRLLQGAIITSALLLVNRIVGLFQSVQETQLTRNKPREGETMPLTKLDDTTAFIVIDLQKGIVGLPSAHPAGEIIGRAAQLARAFRECGLPVVLVNVTGRAPGRTDRRPRHVNTAGGLG